MFYPALDKKKKPTITEDLIRGLDIGNQSSYTTPTEKAMAPHSSPLAWKIHGQRSLVGCSPWGREESDTTERLPFHFSLSCIGEGNGNPLLFLPGESQGRGAWWAAVCGVAELATAEATWQQQQTLLP